MNSEEEVQFVDPTRFESNSSIPQTPIGHSQQSASSSLNQPKSKKRKVSNEEEVALVGNLTETVNNLRAMCQASSKGIDKLTDCFQFLVDDQALKKIYEAIVEIPDLVLHESLMVKAGLIIARDSTSPTYFFSLPQRLRKYHVLDVLGLGHS
ncbi:hypothetical protein COCNU_scaffold026604G000010 [Cocos nucifera]|nr:hypothetical protein [Cocos nucifera]